MTVWEKLFGDPIRTAETLEYVDLIVTCDFMDCVGESKFPPEKCKHCMYDFDRYGCEQTDMTLLEWLRQEVD